MTIYSASLSLIAGLILGTCYGLFFLHQRRRVFLLDPNTPLYQHYILTVLSSIGRLMLLVLIWYYLLLSPAINFILLLSSFLGAFWVTILTQKV